MQSYTNADGTEEWRLPLNNKDRMYIAIHTRLDGQPGYDWSLLLSPKRETPGVSDSTIYEVYRGLREHKHSNGVVSMREQWTYHSRPISAIADESLIARILVLKVKQDQIDFFDHELRSIRLSEAKYDRDYDSRTWVYDALNHLRHIGFTEVPATDRLQKQVEAFGVECRRAREKSGGRQRREVPWLDLRANRRVM